MATSSLSNDKIVLSKLWWAGLLGGVSAAVINVAVYFAAQAFLGLIVMPLQPGNAPEPLPLIAVVLASFVPSIGATLLFALLGKFAPRPSRIFVIVSALFLLLSLGGPLTLPIALASQLVLCLMHTVAGASIVGALLTLGRA